MKITRLNSRFSFTFYSSVVFSLIYLRIVIKSHFYLVFMFSSKNIIALILLFDIWLESVFFSMEDLDYDL